ncbi:MFS general substrate transporter [Rhizodiscina lignyota]|uniref:MFS general substrate transporter n=1 Tax=Rhizodiscina lignyota TaxID=1504668 RepID=A0A9P4M588_9PEZI|nr:MFS general substrate transporter [Rhizodiscina lignyota]
MAEKEYLTDTPPLKGEESKVEYAAAQYDGEPTNGELKTLDHGFTDVYDHATPEEELRVLRKIDYRLVPLLALLYLVAFVDRSNIGNAKIAGLSDDLKLVGMDYNVALTVFFVPYALFEIPSNIVLKILRPSIWISILLFCWGLVMTLMGIVNSYGGLIACRFFLGVAESGFFPGATFLLTLWYKRYEVQRRMAVFYAAASLSGAFSGLLAFAIESMKGDDGLDGWQWIFIIEGLVPVALAFVIWWLLPDNPETAKFLTKDEKELIINRLALETGSGKGKVTNSDKIQMKYIIAALKEWKTWAAVVMFWGNTIGVYGFTSTVPTVIEQLGYSSANAQLMTIPIYVFAMIMTLIFAWWGDYVQQRSPFIMAGFGIAAVGFIAELAIPHPRLPGVTYGFLFPVAAGLYCPFISIVTWTANNAAPSSKRAIAMALLISAGNLGGIAGSNVFIAAQAPVYHVGFGTCLASSVCAMITAFVLRIAYARENRQRKALLDEMGEEAIRARYTDQELLDLGDKAPFFIYTL